MGKFLTMRKFLTTAVALCVATIAAATAPGDRTQTLTMADSTKLAAFAARKAEIPAGPVVEISTTEGPIKVKLYDDTPEHRDNFLKHIGDGYYDGVLFHRVIKDFMVQTGDPKSIGAPAGEMLGAGDPGYTLPAEIVYPKHYHKYGALAAARTGDQFNPERRSSGSQFYIVTGKKFNRRQAEQMVERALDAPRQEEFYRLQMANKDTIMSLRRSGDKEGLEALRLDFVRQLDSIMPRAELPSQMIEDYVTIGGAPHLDGQYTVFGEVLDGMEVVEKIQHAATDSNDRPLEDIKILGVRKLD